MPFPVDVSFVKATESKLGVTFPLAFVARMTSANGGEVQADGDVWQLHPFLDTSDRTRLKRTCNDIVREMKVAKDWPDFPANGIAIGANGSGDLLVLLASPSSPDRLQDAAYVWDHETGDLSKVAEDLAELP